MKITVLLHSTTGNTRLITKYAAAYLESLGHECEIIDIVRRPAPPDLEGVDLLGIAAPTMYFRPSFVMEEYVARLPNTEQGSEMPAFLLNSSGGMPGSTFSILGDLLAYKGYVALGAHGVMAPSNWPVHVAAMEKIELTKPLSAVVDVTPKKHRWIWAMFWERAALPDNQDKRNLEVFLKDIVSKAERGKLKEAPPPRLLFIPIAGTGKLGQIIPRDLPDIGINIHIDPKLCTACGTCIMLCPERIIVRETEDEIPKIEKGCSGCYACYNHCPEGAIGDFMNKPGQGRYRCPPRSMRELFRWQDK